MPGHVLRSADGLTGFGRGLSILPDTTRHTAVLKRGDTLHVFWSNIGDTPEHILHSTVDLFRRLARLACHRAAPRPETGTCLEGATAPMRASVMGAIDEPVNELRDPCIFEEDGRVYLLYSGAGERISGLPTFIYRSLALTPCLR